MSSRPSPLAISTASVQRLLKEESTYRAELASQESRLKKLEYRGDDVEEDDDEEGNRDWSVRQQKRAIEETKAVFAPLREKVLAAAGSLEQLLKSRGAEHFDKDEVERAKELIEKAKVG
ncbi:MAG: hypothetical protein LQ338_007388 [Usnochroma carphineum]|nr:MAG: hypothetical protein LQ338_007388 [Usnochroma carphineum]